MSLNNLQKRLNFRGGKSQVDRMIDDKQRSLDWALRYSYQSATVALQDNREFQCLINPNKISMEIDDKMLSIPFRDKCLNGAGADKEDIGVKVGDVITWKRQDRDSHWIIYSQYLQETAYFRGLMRQCEDEPIEINGKVFYYYLKGPDEKGIDWQKSKHFIFNDLNYTLEIYISNTTETKEFFQRFKKLKIHERPFEVQAVDDLTTTGILAVYLKEDYTNQWAPAEEAPEETPLIPEGQIGIDGPATVYPYETVEYTILNSSAGRWILSNNRARIIESTVTSVKIEVITGKSGDVSLIYRTGLDNSNDVIKNIKILSL